MNHVAQSFITTPRGKLRAWCGVLFLGFPLLFLFAWITDSSAWEIHVTGIARFVTIATLSALLFVSILAGIYFILFERVVLLDPEAGCVTTVTRVWNRPIHRRAWRLCEFQRVEVRHRSYGDGPTDAFQSDVGISHASGFVLWLRGFLSQDDGPSSEALAFAQELSDKTGLLLTYAWPLEELGSQVPDLRTSRLCHLFTSLVCRRGGEFVGRKLRPTRPMHSG
jgi:hypothetical protein